MLLVRKCSRTFQAPGLKSWNDRYGVESGNGSDIQAHNINDWEKGERERSEEEKDEGAEKVKDRRMIREREERRNRLKKKTFIVGKYNTVPFCQSVSWAEKYKAILHHFYFSKCMKNPLSSKLWDSIFNRFCLHGFVMEWGTFSHKRLIIKYLLRKNPVRCNRCIAKWSPVMLSFLSLSCPVKVNLSLSFPF